MTILIDRDGYVEMFDQLTAAECDAIAGVLHGYAHYDNKIIYGRTEQGYSAEIEEIKND